MSPLILELLKALGPIILGGSLLIGISQLVKSRAEAHKTRVEADQIQSTAGISAEGITTAAMREAIDTIRGIAEDANAAKDRAEASETRIRNTNDTLWQKVEDMEESQRDKDRELRDQRRRILRLERNLASAHTVVVSLVDYINEHAPDGDPPGIDYSIFES